MKTVLSKLIFSALSIVFLLSSCSKESIFPTPQPNEPLPNNPAGMGLFRFVANANLTGLPYHTSNLSTIVTIANDKNEEVVKEKVLTVNLDGSIKTETLQLPVGNYKLTRLRINYGGVNTHFVAPIANSSKASQVQKPLSLEFTVVKDSTSNVAVEILKIQQGEKPQMYGYPVGAFDDNQAENSPFLKVKIKAIMQIGDVLYDSIPASLALSTWDANGEMTTSYVGLKAGVNEISILKAASKFRFRADKWGTSKELTVERANVNEDTVYVFTGNKAAKKLKSEMTYKLVEGYIPDTKTDYNYDASGRLSQIQFYEKRNNITVHTRTDVFEYSGARVEKITRHNKENNSVIGYTSFSYDGQGRVSRMAHNENGEETNAAVDYQNYEMQEVAIRYQYPGKNTTMDYFMRYDRGNLFEATAVTSTQNTENGRYNYDFNINPYIHMKWPNLFLSNNSKNNVTGQYKTYYGSYPTAMPYSFNYSYDGDGYPKELVKQFKSYTNNTHLFTIKTVFVY